MQLYFSNDPDQNNFENYVNTILITINWLKPIKLGKELKCNHEMIKWVISLNLLNYSMHNKIADNTDQTLVFHSLYIYLFYYI